MKMKRWVVAPCQTDAQQHLISSGFSPLAAAALCARGLASPQQAQEFLSTAWQDLHDPFDLPDMENAVRVITHALRAKTTIAVFGDYDVDGVTATCMMVHYLRSCGAEVHYFLPNRLREGYGLNAAVVEQMAATGAQLLITVDGGVSAWQEVDYAKSLGMQVVITDHHQCPEIMPEAQAVINPKWSESEYPFADLAGVGVAFKLICALAGEARLPEMLDRYAALVALGSVADVMPLYGENRTLVAYGLQRMRDEAQVGLQALLLEAGQFDKAPTASAISYILAPRINAAGRMGQAELAVELFLTQDAARAKQLAVTLCEQNRARQNTETEILHQALVQLKKTHQPVRDKTIVLAGEGWHHGVLGIVASRLCDRYACPVFLIAIEDGVGKGSGRAPFGFNLYEALSNSAQLMDKFGGHAMAAGLTIAQDAIPVFRQQFEQYACDHYDAAAMVPILHIDAAITPDMITLAAVEGMAVLEPFGMGNPQPVFSMHNLIVEDITPLSSDKHVRLSLRNGRTTYTAMLFGTGAGGVDFAQGNAVDAAFHLEVNRFRGRANVQLVVKDVRLSESEVVADQKILNLYNCFINDGTLRPSHAALLLPSRPDLVAVWRHVVSRAENQHFSAHANACPRCISWESRREINLGKLLVCLDVFSESQLLSYHFHEGRVQVQIKHAQGKADISQSVVLATLQRMSQASPANNAHHGVQERSETI